MTRRQKAAATGLLVAIALGALVVMGALAVSTADAQADAYERPSNADCLDPDFLSRVCPLDAGSSHSSLMGD